MGVTEEFLRMMVEVKGAQALPDLQAKLAAVGTQQQALKSQYASATITESELEKQTRKLASAKADLTAQIGKLEKGLDSGKSKLAGFGQTGLQTGRVVQDFAQGGIGGVLNNIEGFTQSIGLGPGAAGALTTLGVAAFVVGPHLRTLAQEMGFFKDESYKARTTIKHLEEQIKKLSEAPIKLAIDSQNLEQAEKRLETLKTNMKAFEELGALKGKDVKTSGARVVEALEEAPGGADKLEQKMLFDRNKELEQGDAILQANEKKLVGLRHDLDGIAKLGPGRFKEAAKLEAINEIGRIEEDNAKRRLRIEEQIQNEIGEKFKLAKAGDADAQQALANLLRASGRDEMAWKIESASPEKVKEERKAAEGNAQLIAPEAVAGHMVEQGEAVAAPAKAAQARKRRVMNPDGTFRWVGPGELEKERVQRRHARRVAALAETVAEREARQAEQAKTIGETTLEKETAEAAAELGKNRGGEDQFGIFRRMNPEQQRNEIHRRLLRELKDRFPGISKEDAKAQAQRIGGEAFGDAGRERAAVGAQVRAMGGGEAQAQAAGNQGAVNAALAELAKQQAAANVRLKGAGIVGPRPIAPQAVAPQAIVPQLFSPRPRRARGKPKVRRGKKPAPAPEPAGGDAFKSVPPREPGELPPDRGGEPQNNGGAARGVVQNFGQVAGNQAAMVAAQGEILQSLAEMNARLNRIGAQAQQVGRQAGQQTSRFRTAQPNIVPF